MKVIQINAWHFKYLSELIDFLKQEQPDIINFQEVSTGKFNYCDPAIHNPFDYVKTELGMNGLFSPFSSLKSPDNTISLSGNGFLTSLEIVDHGTFFEASLPGFTEYNEDHELIQTTLKNDKSKYYSVFEEPKNYVWAVLKTKDGRFIRNLTTHFTVSYGCMETLQILKETESVLNFLSSVKVLPTIFTGDLNIHDKSASIAKLSQVMTMVNSETKNTLHPSHPALKSIEWFKGLKVDYIFQKGFQITSCIVPEVTVSDHLPVIAELELF